MFCGAIACGRRRHLRSTAKLFPNERNCANKLNHVICAPATPFACVGVVGGAFHDTLSRDGNAAAIKQTNARAKMYRWKIPMLMVVVLAGDYEVFLMVFWGFFFVLGGLIGLVGSLWWVWRVCWFIGNCLVLVNVLVFEKWCLRRPLPVNWQMTEIIFQ